MGEPGKTSTETNAAPRGSRGLIARLGLSGFTREQKGATAIEYALIVSLIFLAIITGVTAFGEGNNKQYKYIGDEIDKVLD